MSEQQQQQQIPPGPMPVLPNGQQPTPEQIMALRRQLAIDAEKNGMTVEEFVNHLRQQQAAMMRQQQQQGPPQLDENGRCGDPNCTTDHRVQQQQQGAQPIQPGPPNPIAIALANFLRSQDLKPRTVILNGERKDMFRVKRALRAIESPAYQKARAKTPGLPEITDRASLENCFKLLPLSMLALRVVQTDPHEGHDHGPVEKKKRKKGEVKGQWTVRIEGQQDAGDDMYYVWLYEGSQVMRKVYAGLALLAIFAVVCYPLWPLKMRQGVYYLSWLFLGFLGLFFAMAIFRVILFCITYFVASPGLWLYPNLWEDVSFMDSFRPVWAWHDPNPKKKKKSKSSSGAGGAAEHFAGKTGQPAPATANMQSSGAQVATAMPSQRAGYSAPQVEEVDE